MNDALDILQVDVGLLMYEIIVSQRCAFDDLDSKFNGFLVKFLLRL